MELSEILARAPGPFLEKEQDKLETVARAVVSRLSKHDDKLAPLGTVALAGLLGGATDITSKWIRVTRQAGLLEGYFTKGKPARGTFGKPSYKWHNDPERLF